MTDEEKKKDQIDKKIIEDQRNPMEQKEQKNKKSDSLEDKSLEELHKQIEKGKRKASRSIVFAIAAIIAIIAIGVAWFVNNTRVNVTGIRISAKNGLNFELATVGESNTVDTKKSPLKNFIENIGGIIGENYSASDGNGTVTSAAKSSIQWNMSGDHQNFANVVGSGIVDGTGDENIGLQPGTYGELTFYIIPKIDGAQTVNCTISLTPYVETEKKSGAVETVNSSIAVSDGKNVWEITDERVKKVLSGHIYFFMKKETGDNGLYSEWLQPDENGLLHFSVDLQDETKKDEPKQVTIYWNWPTLMSQVLLKNDDAYLGGRSQLFSQDTQDKIVRFMCDGGSKSTSNEDSGDSLTGNFDTTQFFFTKVNGDKDADIIKGNIQKIHNVSWETVTDSFTRDEYSVINQLYNNADQFLGKTVSYVSLELSATN